MTTPAASPTEQYGAAEVGVVVRDTRKSKPTPQVVRSAPVFLLYKYYLRPWTDADDPKLKTLEQFCRRFKWIPSLELINSIIHKANIIDEEVRLNFPIYAFMEFHNFKVCISDTTGEPRLFVGHLVREHGATEEVWAGWSGAKKGSRERITAANTRLYHVPRVQKETCEIEFNPEVRKHIRWDYALDDLFGLGQLHHIRNLQCIVQIQNAILLSVAKVLLRFPGLMQLADCRRRRRGFGFTECSRRPFTRFDRAGRRSLPLRHPFQATLDILNFGPSPADGVHDCHPPDPTKTWRQRYLEHYPEDSEFDLESIPDSDNT
ncbi:hypothetical protein M436DRAFT_82685 [Aureobasidium namibiae CBS 147.97]|uniref:Uncharacterized protein n=1 Tax=Aureobasidium namibiae CBS 147.97 TaxID=1043004 RepID=A0A074WHR9_9PEZI